MLGDGERHWEILDVTDAGKMVREMRHDRCDASRMLWFV